MTQVALEPTVRELFALRPGIYSGRTADGRLYLFTWRRSQSLGRPGPGLRAVLRRLAGPAAAEEDLRFHAGIEPVERMLRQLAAQGWLAITVAHGGRPIYTVVPERHPPGPPPDTAPPGLVMSRFALLRRDGSRLVMESPRSWCRVDIEDPAALAASGVLGPRTGANGPADGVPPVLVDRLRRDLWWAGMVVPGADTDVEAGELRLRQWSPHELWFHDRSRLGRRGLQDGFGRTWWARGVFGPVPARCTPFPGETIDLYRPDLSALRASDPPLTAVIEDRRSIRRHDDAAPVTVQQLGELLYRCSRNRGIGTQRGVEYLSRPHPSGGSVYELELYPVVRHVAGIDAGLYHYDPDGHRLERVCGPNTAVRRLLGMAALSSGEEREPQLLIVIAARFGRLMWTYEAIPYALILKHVGVLYQMMYLVATAMGLASCALGTGDSDAFAEATGRDPLVESSVGEFMIGGCMAADRAGPALT